MQVIQRCSDAASQRTVVVLSGPAGCGKTFALHAAAAAMPSLHPDVIPVYVNLRQQIVDGMVPSQTIAQKALAHVCQTVVDLPDKGKNVASLVTVRRILQIHNRRLLLLLDDIQYRHAQPGPARLIRAQDNAAELLHALSGSHGGLGAVLCGTGLVQPAHHVQADAPANVDRIIKLLYPRISQPMAVRLAQAVRANACPTNVRDVLQHLMAAARKADTTDMFTDLFI